MIALQFITIKADKLSIESENSNLNTAIRANTFFDKAGKLFCK